jgi:hypothetical protein
MNLPDKNNLTLEAINNFIAKLRSVPDNRSFAHFKINRDCDQIEATELFEHKEQKTVELIEFFEKVERRRPYFGKIVDYVSCKSNKTIEGDDLGICPICGKKGEILPPFEEFKGETLHVIKPLYMGAEIVEACDWGEE